MGSELKVLIAGIRDAPSVEEAIEFFMALPFKKDLDRYTTATTRTTQTTRRLSSTTPYEPAPDNNNQSDAALRIKPSNIPYKERARAKYISRGEIHTQALVLQEQGLYNIPEKRTQMVDGRDIFKLPTFEQTHLDTDNLEELFESYVDKFSSDEYSHEYLTVTAHEADVRRQLGFPQEPMVPSELTLRTRRHFPGIHSPYAYVSNGITGFAMHREDYGLPSRNVLHNGMPKIWGLIPPEGRPRFEKLLSKVLGTTGALCDQFVRHRSLLPTPSFLRNNGIPFELRLHRKGEVVEVSGDAYHFGINTGSNIAEAINDAGRDWIAPPCYVPCNPRRKGWLCPNVRPITHEDLELGEPHLLDVNTDWETCEQYPPGKRYRAKSGGNSNTPNRWKRRRIEVASLSPTQLIDESSESEPESLAETSREPSTPHTSDSDSVNVIAKIVRSSRDENSTSPNDTMAKEVGALSDGTEGSNVDETDAGDSDSRITGDDSRSLDDNSISSLTNLDDTPEDSIAEQIASPIQDTHSPTIERSPAGLSATFTGPFATLPDDFNRGENGQLESLQRNCQTEEGQILSSVQQPIGLPETRPAPSNRPLEGQRLQRLKDMGPDWVEFYERYTQDYPESNVYKILDLASSIATPLGLQILFDSFEEVRRQGGLDYLIEVSKNALEQGLPCIPASRVDLSRSVAEADSSKAAWGFFVRLSKKSEYNEMLLRLLSVRLEMGLAKHEEEYNNKLREEKSNRRFSGLDKPHRENPKNLAICYYLSMLTGIDFTVLREDRQKYQKEKDQMAQALRNGKKYGDFDKEMEAIGLKSLWLLLPQNSKSAHLSRQQVYRSQYYKLANNEIIIFRHSLQRLRPFLWKIHESIEVLADLLAKGVPGGNVGENPIPSANGLELLQFDSKQIVKFLNDTNVLNTL